MFNQLFASKKNPRFKQDSQWDRLRFDLSGCQLEISLPPQDWEFAEEPRPSRVNLFDPNLYQYEDEPDKNGYEAHYKGITKSAVWTRHWLTYGSLFSGRNIGTLQCAATVIDTSRMKEQLNCFNPRHMEALVIHDLYYAEGPGFGGNEYTAPVNWKILNLDGSEWVYSESWPSKCEWEDIPDPYDAVNFRVGICAPLFNDKYLLVSFNVTGSLPPEASNKLMFERITKIISSVKLTLSPEGEKQKQEILGLGACSNYSAARQPENWKYYGSYRLTEDGIEFEGLCSPPPNLG